MQKAPTMSGVVQTTTRRYVVIHQRKKSLASRRGLLFRSQQTYLSLPLQMRMPMSDAGQSVDIPARKRSPVGPECEACGSATILKMFSPHPTLPGQELRIYACPNCKREETVTSPTPE